MRGVDEGFGEGERNIEDGNGYQPPSETWRALTKIAAETREAANDRAKSEFESLEVRLNETAAEYFSRVHVCLTKLTTHHVTTPVRELKPRVLCGLTPCFRDEVRVYEMKGNFDLKALEAGLARVESFQSDQEKRDTSAHVLAVAHEGGGRTGARSEARDRGQTS